MNPTQSETDLQCRIFCTNIDSNLMAARLVYILEKTTGILSWNLDLEDHDKVLRINYARFDFPSFNRAVCVFGIEIEELPIW